MTMRSWFVLLVGLAVAAGAPGAIQVRLSPEVIYAGDAFTLEVSSGDGEIRDVAYQFSAPVQTIGRSQRVQIFNGARSTSLQFTLLPEGEGLCRLEQLEATMADGSVERCTEQPSLRVKRLEADSAIELSARVVRADQATESAEAAAEPLLPGDEVTIEVSVSAPAVELDGQRRSPFWGPDLFGRMTERQPQVAFRAEVPEDAPLQLRKRPSLEGPVEEGERLRWTWRFSYVAVRTGKQLFAAPILNDRRLTGVDERGQGQFVRSAAIGQALSVEVTQPPAEGRPQGFTGAICRAFEVQVGVDAQNVKMGDPVAVRVEIAADCDSALLRAPEIETPPGFRRYGEPTREKRSSGACFIYRLRPIQPGLLEIPPLPFAWFDRTQRIYREATSSAVPLRVRPSAQLVLANAEGEIAAATLPPALLLPSTEALEAQAPRLRPERWALGCLLAGLCALAARLLWRPVVAACSALRRALKRSPQARALAALKRAKSAQEAAAAVRDWAERPALTAFELRALLGEPAAEAGSAAYETLERAVYAGQGDWQTARAQLVALLGRLKRTAQTLLLLGAALVAWHAEAQGDPFIREQAEALTIAATDQAQYAEALRVWQQLIEAGECSVSVLQNGAACALLARSPQVALALTRRLVWLHGWRPDAAQLLTAAYAQLEEVPGFLTRLWPWWPGVGRTLDGACVAAGALLLLGVLLSCRRRPQGRAAAVLCLTVVLAASAQGKLVKATWGVNPAAPIYVGQSYELTLTVESDDEEEITGLQADQGPQAQPEQRVARDGKRRITTFAWVQQEASARLETIPQTRLRVQLTRVQTFGFDRRIYTTTESTRVPAFSYEVIPLPEEARGAAIGTFAMTLQAKRGTYAPGDVREVTATLQAISGGVPDDFAFAWQSPENFPGRLYPFRPVERSRTRLVAKAWVVPDESAQAATLTLAPLRLFDVATRQCALLQAPTLDLAAPSEAETSEAPEAPAPDEPALLRFAPHPAAPILAPLEPGWTLEAQRETWGFVRTPTGRSGWVPLADLPQQEGR